MHVLILIVTVPWTYIHAFRSMDPDPWTQIMRHRSMDIFPRIQIYGSKPIPRSMGINAHKPRSLYLDPQTQIRAPISIDYYFHGTKSIDHIYVDPYTGIYRSISIYTDNRNSRIESVEMDLQSHICKSISINTNLQIRICKTIFWEFDIVLKILRNSILIILRRHIV